MNEAGETKYQNLIINPICSHPDCERGPTNTGDTLYRDDPFFFCCEHRRGVEMVSDTVKMMGKYILDDDGNPQIEPDVIKWAEWFERTQPHVAITEIGCARISTVFLGLDHNCGEKPPLLWETVVFGGKFDGEMKRWSTLKDAKNGHNAMVGKVTRDGLLQVPYSSKYGKP